MKIGIDASRANLEQKTGTEWYSYKLIQEFKKIADPQDQFFLYSKDKLKYGLEKLPDNFVSVVLSWFPKFMWTQLRLSINQLFNKPDVLFVPAHTIPIIHAKPTVLTVHDVGFERMTELYSTKNIGPKGWKKRLIYVFVKIITLGKYGSNELDYHRWSMRYALKNAAKIIVPSKFTKDEIVNIFKVEPKKIKVIMHGVDIERYYPIEDRGETKKVLHKYMISDPFVLYIGRLEEKKNTQGLVSAFALMKKKYQLPHKLVLVGSPGFGFDKVRNEILNSGLSREIIMTGYVDGQDIVYLVNGADVFVLPSYYEGFGLPVIEAMACGTPVITSLRASLPEVAGNAAILVNPSDYDELSEAMNNVISNQKLRQRMVSLGYERIKMFNWANCATETLKEIKETVL
ncbi:glycosyltransferase family 4 protein [Patescibacteria group bacterium]|nr:glycosyltransferase family 4 protein [Patescibacteria group bacterium]MBU1890905.1 glycosyltransferase family 4 protein [Patescibacteria group bacterium]